MTRKVDIRPGMNILSVLRHLNYQPWYALGEFVDNSVQSFLARREEINKAEGGEPKLCVEIDLRPTSTAHSISIRDNAAGISEAEYERAFRPAALPSDTSGLSEFGMGMKSAACWFADTWSVRTTSLGEDVARTIAFDISNIVEDDIKELEIQEEPTGKDKHYTEITLKNVARYPKGRTVGKIKEHLTDIYREFMRQGILELKFNSEYLQYEEPKILSAPWFKEPEGKAKKWRKPIEFDFGNGLSARGFAGILETGSTGRAGFSLFRRNRVIQGSGDEGYRPEHIFGRSNSYRYQRVFGELHLEGFDVSHTKDGFRWDENEEPFLKLLKDHLDSEDLPLLKQAEGYRVRPPRPDLEKPAKEAVANTVEALQEKLQDVVDSIADKQEGDAVEEPARPHHPPLANQSFEFQFRGKPWRVDVELTNDSEGDQWLTLLDKPADTAKDIRSLGIRVSLAHPFMVRFAHVEVENIEALLRAAAAIALATSLARSTGSTRPGTIMTSINEILRDALSSP